MRKNIDIKEEDVQPLKILAVLANKDLKNYIQDVLNEHVMSTFFLRGWGLRLSNRKMH